MTEVLDEFPIFQVFNIYPVSAARVGGQFLGRQCVPAPRLAPAPLFRRAGPGGVAGPGRRHEGPAPQGAVANSWPDGGQGARVASAGQLATSLAPRCWTYPSAEIVGVNFDFFGEISLVRPAPPENMVSVADENF